MSARRWLSLACLVALAGGAAVVLRPRPTRTIADLVEAFPTARQQPAASAFSVQSVAIDDDIKPSIVASGQTRLTSHVTLPKHAELRVSFALHPSVWDAPGDGVMFLVGVSDGHVYRTLESVTLLPEDRAAVRHWHERRYSLEEYADLTVDIILNTRAGQTPGAPLRGELAVWGAPKVISQ